MSAEWKPGTFVSGEFEGQRDQGVVTEQGDLIFWNHTGGHIQEEPLSTLTDVRPLVVLDPESDTDRLWNIIREVDGNHDLGAGALAEAILERLAR
jgi:hypothetical protein